MYHTPSSKIVASGLRKWPNTGRGAPASTPVVRALSAMTPPTDNRSSDQSYKTARHATAALATLASLVASGRVSALGVLAALVAAALCAPTAWVAAALATPSVLPAVTLSASPPPAATTTPVGQMAGTAAGRGHQAHRVRHRVTQCVGIWRALSRVPAPDLSSRAG